MIHLLIGAAVTAGFWCLVRYSRKSQSAVHWWQWLLTILAFLYTAFIVEMIVGFLSEGAARAALVTGILFGFIAVVWGVLLGRFVFKPKTK
jgi:hypothetical protein